MSQGLILSPTLVIYNIAIYSDDSTDIASDLWQQLKLDSKLESERRDTVDWTRKLLVDFNAGKT